MITPLTIDTVKQSIANATASNMMSNKLIWYNNDAFEGAKIRIICQFLARVFAYFNEFVYFCSKFVKK